MALDKCVELLFLLLLLFDCIENNVTLPLKIIHLFYFMRGGCFASMYVYAHVCSTRGSQRRASCPL